LVQPKAKGFYYFILFEVWEKVQMIKIQPEKFKPGLEMVIVGLGRACNIILEEVSTQSNLSQKRP